MSDLLPLRLVLEALPVHGISGYEWECDSCHYHWAKADTCVLGVSGLWEGEYDTDHRVVDHQHLVDRDAVLAAIDAVMATR